MGWASLILVRGLRFVWRSFIGILVGESRRDKEGWEKGGDKIGNDICRIFIVG